MKGLRAKRTGLLQAGKAVGESKVAKDKAIKEYLATFPWIAQTLEALSRLADERELADRIRTSVRRAIGNRGEASQEASSDDSSSEETASSATSSEETEPFEDTASSESSETSETASEASEA